MRLKRALKITGIGFGVLGLVAVGIGIFVYTMDVDPFTPLYGENCAVCHGEAFEGAAQGPALVGRALTSGDSVAQLSASIANGFPKRGMPGWSAVLNEAQIRGLAILIAERRANQTFGDFQVDRALRISPEPVKSELVSFRIETMVDGIDPMSFSIAPLPDGSILVTEKVRGLSVVSPSVHTETLIGDLARIRDVEVGPGGVIYLLLEHASGSRIVRLLRATTGG